MINAMARRRLNFSLDLPRSSDLFNRETLFVAIFVLAWSLAWSYGSETILDWVPKLRTAQLKVHQWVFRSDIRRSHVKWVTVVEVDDDSFNQPPVSGNTPTNRKFLGEVALKAAERDPAVIAIDFRFFISAEKGPADSARTDNTFLLDAIRTIARSGIPVVLTTYLTKDPQGTRIRMRNVFDDDELSNMASVGHMNMPLDKRKIALPVGAWDWNHTSFKEIPSFAIQIVDAYESVLGIRPKTADDVSIKESTTRNDWVFGGFFGQEEFPHVSAHKLWEGDPDALSKCRHRIVLIGGTWHTTPGTLVDASEATFGYAPNVYLHANYVEALLDGRYKASVAKSWLLLIDFVLSMLIFLCIRAIRRTAVRVWVLLCVFLVPLVLAYFFSVNAGRYLDFVVPLTLCFIDLVRQSVKLRWREPV